MSTNYTTLLSEGLVTGQFSSRMPFVVQETFDLTELAAVLINADTVELFTLPADTLVIAGMMETVTAGTSSTSGSQTLKLRAGTTDLTAALNTLAAGADFTPGTAQYVGAAAQINLLAAIATDVVTLNPVMKVTLICVNVA